MGRRGSSWIFLLPVPRGARKQQDMGQQRWQPLPSWSGLTHPQLLLGQHQRGPTGTRGAGETLGDNDSAGGPGCCPRAPQQLLQQRWASPRNDSTARHGLTATFRGSEGPKFWDEGRSWRRLPALLVCPWGPAGPGSLSAPARGGGGEGKESEVGDAAVLGCTPQGGGRREGIPWQG